ncbi:hypothetical protein [Vibrio vulnificus]|uniref:hypothetical protein n=1 Tax=Vibrio vulnificus TaxID=672 RepID=UPI0005016BAC|nr:hypothetical protein [Vibrio vulnificus]EHY1015330.1 hypothetical protein [Vibrio vulnificus]EHY1123440.1 hypothetical protein [Vibrio vulnificus]KFK48628.1 hypothetical protein JS87_20450 [Vibrio vulnificus]KFK53098.1 hypothetical protein JS86_21860 [Vibrio vulnificus]PNG68709.1 hypothetical protein TI06_21455 [Vibrio vulnificus]
MKKLIISSLLLVPMAYATTSSNTTETSVGKVYVDGTGKTLYTFSKDPVGQSVCTDKCETLWPPLLVNDKASSQFSKNSEFNQVTRKDGSKQWALNGKPLYRWFKDQKEGDIDGAGVKGVWSIARADDVAVKLYNDGSRRYLVDDNNLTLYTFDKDKNNQSVCYGDCEVKWPPAYVDSDLTQKGIDNIKLTGGFGVTKRKDDTYQWTFEGKPLYRWFKDSQAGETTGDGVKNVWHLITQ